MVTDILLQHSTHSSIRGVHHDTGQCVRLRVNQQGSVSKSILDSCESCCGVFRPAQGLLVSLGCREEVAEWLQNSGALRNKAVVEINEAEKFPKLAWCCWLGKGSYCLDLAGEWSDALGIDVVAQEFQLWDYELTLGCVDVYAMCTEAIKHQS